jgi:hypothetical protein
VEFPALGRPAGGIGFLRTHLAWRGAHHSKKNELKPHLKQTWCLGTLDSRFLAHMEALLLLYRLPYDLQHPVVCFDERPCFLIGDTLATLTMKSGRVCKKHYADEKHGSCALLAAMVSLTGHRLAQVHPSTAHQTRIRAVFLGLSRPVSPGGQNSGGARQLEYP